MIDSCFEFSKLGPQSPQFKLFVLGFLPDMCRGFVWTIGTGRHQYLTLRRRQLAVMIRVVIAGAPGNSMRTVLVKEGTSFSSAIAFPGNSAMCARFGEYDCITGRCRNLIDNIWYLSLDFAVPPVLR